MTSLKNWDNKTWISSNKYIKSFNSFLLNHKKLNRKSKILDIGCGRGKIIGALSARLKLTKKPIGIDIKKHKDIDKRIIFKNINVIKYLKDNKKKFDLILIKQVIHFFNLRDIRILLNHSYQNLQPKGMIFILSIDQKNNEIPNFFLMKKKLQQSFKKEALIKQNILSFKGDKIIKKFNFKVSITKKKYISMLKQRYISSLLTLNDNQILKGIEEIKLKYKNSITFKDNLNCIIIKKSDIS